MTLAQCTSAASPFVRPLWAGFVSSLVTYCTLLVSICHGGSVCVGVTLSTFLGISPVTTCIVDSLNLFGMPGFLLVGLMGRGEGAALCLPASRCKWTGSRSCTGFVVSTLATNLAAAR